MYFQQEFSSCGFSTIWCVIACADVGREWGNKILKT